MMWDSLEKNDVVECLRALALGASVNDTYESSLSDGEIFVQSAVQRAAQLKHWNMVALLLLWGADAEYRDSLGRNLIHYLASNPDSSISVLLSVLRKNSSLGGWTDYEGRTPLLYAEMAENAPVATIIRVFQAQVDESAASRAGGPKNGNNSGQESPSLSEDKSTLSANQISTALEKVLNLTQNGPFNRRKSKSK
jgi:ankyrin repeat protein